MARVEQRKAVAIEGGRRCRRVQAGYTVVEILVVIAVATIIGTVTLSFFSSWLPRQELKGAVRQSLFLISKARLEAIQRGVHTVVQADYEGKRLVAFADVNGDSTVGSAGYANYLVYDPDPLQGEKQTDYEIGDVLLQSSLFGGPEGYSVVDGGTTVPNPTTGSQQVLVFSPTGAPESVGGVRFADSLQRNHFEAAITSLAGKVEVRKFLRAEDSPSSKAGFFEEAWQRDGVNIWVWY